MKQEIINKALEKIQEKKRSALAEFESKMQELYADENYQNLYKKYTQRMIENARLESNGEIPDKAKEQELEEKIERLKENYQVQNIEPKFSCTLCKDKGYKNGQMCKCLKKEVSKILLQDSGFEKLENFDNATSGNLTNFFNLMKDWCKSDFKKYLIYIAGPTGVGKTFLIRCMANELIEQGKMVKIVTAFKLNQDFKEFSKKQESELLDKYLETEILFIDDLGTEPLYRNVTIENLYLIINERKMRKLPTIITSNLSLSDLQERYDERIYSRIVDRQSSITIYLDGQDRRIQTN